MCAESGGPLLAIEREFSLGPRVGRKFPSDIYCPVDHGTPDTSTVHANMHGQPVEKSKKAVA